MTPEPGPGAGTPAPRGLGRPITTSIFELLKVGPGPSSSHTMAPMRAGHHFLGLAGMLEPAALGASRSIEVRLYGSLGATGKGHGTDRAVLAGLLGQSPETCPSEFLDGLASEGAAEHALPVPGASVTVSASSVHFEVDGGGFPHPNTLLIRLLGDDGPLLEQEYYSVGGGFLQWKGWRAPERGEPRFPYATMDELKALVRESGLPLHALILENERALTGATEAQILAGLDGILEAMEDSVQRGLRTEGTLPGPLALVRRAPHLLGRARAARRPEVGFMVLLSAWAIAAAEENAAGHRIVTAPTAGSAGVVASVAHAARHHFDFSHEQVREGLLAAAAIGFLCRQNASIAGAEVGCQGEVGVASSMAAALVGHAFGLPLDSVESAAEIAMEHHLGLTCDPVGGFVQIPCIERCALGASKAYSAVLLAGAEVHLRRAVSFDRVVRVMAETGRDMSSKYKETSEGGLALSFVEC